MNRIWGVVRLRLERNSEKAFCAAARVHPRARRAAPRAPGGFRTARQRLGSIRAIPGQAGPPGPSPRARGVVPSSPANKRFWGPSPRVRGSRRFASGPQDR